MYMSCQGVCTSSNVEEEAIEIISIWIDVPIIRLVAVWTVLQERLTLEERRKEVGRSAKNDCNKSLMMESA